MAHGFKDVTRHNPCPLCGKDHWCSWLPSEYGRILFCQKEEGTGIIMGRDGCNYVRIGTSGSGAGVFEEETQYNKRMGDLKAAKALGQPVKSSYTPTALTIIDEVKPLKRETLHKIYNRFLDMLVLEDRHREYLHKEGWSDELIDRHKIKSIPVDDYKRYNLKGYYSKNKWRKSICEELVKEFGSLRGVPGFYKKNGVWKILVQVSFSQCTMKSVIYIVCVSVWTLKIRLTLSTKGSVLPTRTTGYMLNLLRGYIT